MQNRSHIKHLKRLLGEHTPVHSVIAFSDRCTLKDIQLDSNAVSVVNRYDVVDAVMDICKRIPENLLHADEISEMYDILYPLSQVSEDEITKHIANIRLWKKD